MIKVAIFVRVSKNSQDYQRQISDLQAYAAKQDYHVVELISEKISGSTKNRNRPGVGRLLELAISGEIQKVLVTEVSRLGRKTSEVLQILETLNDAHVSVFALNYHLETLLPTGKRNPMAQMLFTFLAEFARVEKETMVERIHSGLDQARKEGKILGRRQGTTKPLVKLLEENKKAIRLLKEGKSIREVAKLAEISPNTVQKIKKALG